MSAAQAERSHTLLDRPWHELTSEERIVEAANAVYNNTGSFPVPLSEVADLAEVSRSLIYSHFADQHALFNRVTDLHIAAIEPKALSILSRAKRFDKTALQLSELLLDHFVQHGRLLFESTQDEFIKENPNPRLSRLLRTLLVQLTRLASRQYNLKRSDAIFIVLMMSSIPDETARLIRSGHTKMETGKSILHRVHNLTLETLAEK